MRTSSIITTTIILLCFSASSTIIITQTQSQVFDLGQGDTVIVFGQDIQDVLQTNFPTKTIKDQKSSGIEQLDVNVEQLPLKSSQQVQGRGNSKATRFQSTTTTTTYSRTTTTKKEVHYIKMFSSFGGLGHRSDEQSYRKLVHEDNLKWMQQENNKLNHKFKMAENQFSILTLDQFIEYYLNLEVPSVVPHFDLDFKSEIQKYIQNDNAFINKFFNIDIHHFFNDNIQPSSPQNKGTDTNYTNNKETFTNYTNNNDTSSNQNSQPSENTPQIPDYNLTPDTPEETPSKEDTSQKDKSAQDFSDSSSDSSTDTSDSTANDGSSSSDSPTIPSTEDSSSKDIIPSSIVLDIDWVRQGYVSSIKDQGSCGGCYAFTAQATLESAFLIKNSTLYRDIDLSEQQIIDCSGSQGNYGCNGGWMPYVYKYAISYGTTTQTAYPYLESKSSCQISGGEFKISSYKGGSLSNCSALSLMLTGRPVAVAVSAGNQYWQNYAGGIMDKCGSGSVDHGVTLVGVYQDDTENYWKIKNSWGTDWGENGYIRLDRSVDNICSVCSYGYYPVI